ncbi:hypothetical protein [Paenibacillus sp. SYP-B4298]|uniref:hypothetical protein n=1 Tax=Paenibacillus sp. SYP-B4298 TaxID=2996034 RepID=UPI0022DDF3F4|nr:hypothetical protein [Paenibacillus sp. SYP-B4298]
MERSKRDKQAHKKAGWKTLRFLVQPIYLREIPDSSLVFMPVPEPVASSPSQAQA